jgi:hypothetical protein
VAARRAPRGVAGERRICAATCGDGLVGGWLPRQEGFLWIPGSEQGPSENPRMRPLGSFRGDDYWHNSQAWG